MKLFNNNKVEIEILMENIIELKDKLAQMEIKLEKTPSSTQEYANRLADVEVKVSKLWTLLTTSTPNGQDKLSKYGKVFGGKSKGLL